MELSKVSKVHWGVLWCGMHVTNPCACPPCGAGLKHQLTNNHEQILALLARPDWD